MADENDKKNREEGGDMTVEEAGRKGGETTASKYGPEFYSEIGQEGGRARGDNRDDDSRENQ